jgi:CBS domain containing-hemolysin-like protein
MIYFLLLLFMIVLTFIFSGLEMAFISSSRARLRHMRGNKKEVSSLLEIMQNPKRMLTTLLIATNFAQIFGTVLADHWLASHFQGLWLESLVFFGMTCVFFLFGEVLPKSFFRLSPEACLLALTPIVRLTFKIIGPFEKIVNGVIFFLFQKNWKEKDAFGLSQEEFLSMIETKTKEGVFSQEDQKLILSSVELKTKIPNSVMVPWKDVVTLSEEDSIEILREKAKRTHFTRFPIVSAKQPEKVLGMIDIRDLLFSETKVLSISALLKPLPAIAQEIPLGQIFSKLIDQGSKMAMVYDHHQKPQGLVTLSTLLQVL